MRMTTKKILWHDSALTAFHHLKTLFISTPIQKQCGPILPVGMKVDASMVDAGVILFQHHVFPSKLFPYALLGEQ